MGMASGSVWTTHRREVTREVQGLVHGQLWQVHGVSHESKGNWSLPETICLLLQRQGKCRFNKTYFNSNQLSCICYCIIYKLFCISFSNSTTEILRTSLSHSQVNDLPSQLEKMEELCHLPGFRHDPKLIEETGKFAR